MQTKISLIWLFFSFFVYAQTTPPVLSATGNQIYCPQSTIPIVQSFSLAGSSSQTLEAIYIQISTGYVFGQDLLTLTGNHPEVSPSWDANLGKLTLFALGGSASYTDFTAAVQDVVYSNSSPNPTGNRTFSITIGSANFLPSTGHYYEFVPDIGISWTDARNAAAARTYFGLQGYLTTITSMEEVQITSIQSTGAGWIGGTDEAAEGVWRWATGPEAGTIFWNGAANGSTPNFAFWNTNEPNNLGPEHYAHVTAPNVGLAGAWNDLQLNGDPSGDYQPKGYIVEYGGMPGDPILQISATTSLTMFTYQTVDGSRCDNGSVTLQASAPNSVIEWYTTPTGGLPIFSGNVFTTPILSASTNYYVAINSPVCTLNNRVIVTANIYTNPQFTILPVVPICPGFVGIVDVVTSTGIIRWFESPTATNILSVGNRFFSPALTQTTTYYFEIDNNGCLSQRVPVTINVLPFPDLTPENFEICEGQNQVLIGGSNAFTYLWSTGATSPSITVNQGGTYFVDVNSSDGCIGNKSFTVTTFSQPLIDEILVDFEKVTILILNQGNFLYSIDGINYGPTNVFYIANGGYYVAYVKDLNGCGIVTKPFVFLSIPPFFTPNGDGKNDVWKVDGLNFIGRARVTIYDKYGKLIADLNEKQAWHGTYNGQQLPSTDYWYVITIPESNQIFKGHFSLKR